MISCWNKATNVTLLFDGVFKLQCDESLSVLWVERPLQQGHDVHNSCIEKLSEEICHGLRLCFIIHLDSVLIGSLVQNVSFGDGRWLLGVATVTQKHSSLRKGLVSESGLLELRLELIGSFTVYFFVLFLIPYWTHSLGSYLKQRQDKGGVEFYLVFGLVQSKEFSSLRPHLCNCFLRSLIWSFFLVRISFMLR